MRQAFRALMRLVAGAVLAGLLLAAFGYWQATRPPRVEEVALALPGLAPGSRVRVLLLSDIHGGLPEMPRARIEGIVDAANALRPDLILIAGDFHSAKIFGWPGRFRLEDSLEPLARLKAPLGVFAVRGNHDNDWTNRVMGRAASPVLLVNAAVDLGPFVLAGVDSGNLSPDLAGTLAAVPEGRPLLLLAHEQGQAFTRPLPRPLLLLAGDTHGAQIWFGPLGSPAELRRPFPCRRGACTVNGWPVFVTSGIGTSWAPIRIGVPPEMALITLQASSGRKSGTER